MRNQRADALAYLEEHKILKLFDILGVKLAQQVLITQIAPEHCDSISTVDAHTHSSALIII